jgi:hypothetical protein
LQVSNKKIPKNFLALFVLIYFICVLPQKIAKTIATYPKWCYNFCVFYVNDYIFSKFIKKEDSEYEKY